jgi:enterochelin esterase-like enzyme
MKRILTILFWSLTFVLAGCAPAAPALPATPTPSPSQMLLPSQTPPPTATPQPTPTSTPAVCAETHGRVQTFELSSAATGKPLALRVYTPPCYDAGAAPGYPVLYLLHGQSFNDDQWERLGVPETADRLITGGDSAPFLVVMPREVDYLRDMNESAFGQALTGEVLPWIEENFAVCRETACRAIGGLSRGASWAARLGFESWPLFGAVGLHSMPTAASGRMRYEWLPQIPAGQSPRLYLDIGLRDPYYPYGLAFEDYLNETRLPHEWHLNPGGHDEEYWSAHVEAYLRWYAAGWPPAGR